MTGELNIEVRRAPLAGDELKRHLLALVLAAVLLWYTSLAVPTHAKMRASRAPGEGVHGGERRDGGAEVERGGVEASAENAAAPVEELDWPEYIYPK